MGAGRRGAHQRKPSSVAKAGWRSQLLGWPGLGVLQQRDPRRVLQEELNQRCTLALVLVSVVQEAFPPQKPGAALHTGIAAVLFLAAASAGEPLPGHLVSSAVSALRRALLLISPDVSLPSRDVQGCGLVFAGNVSVS